MKSERKIGFKSAACLLMVGIAFLAFQTSDLQGSVALDLRVSDSSGFINGGFFMQYDDAPTGTGLIDPFLTIQGGPPAGHPQRGYNTDNATFEFDEKDPGTHSILLSDVPVANIFGTDYREFLLDINQAGNPAELSIDQIEIYLETTGDIGSYGSLSNMVFALNTPIVTPITGDESSYNHILLQDSAGSGKGDMLALIPDSLFTGLDSQYVYLYNLTGFAQNGTDGFEEWSLSTNGPIIPEPASLLLLSLGVVPLLRKKKR